MCLTEEGLGRRIDESTTSRCKMLRFVCLLLRTCSLCVSALQQRNASLQHTALSLRARCACCLQRTHVVFTPRKRKRKHTATHCNTLQHTATQAEAHSVLKGSTHTHNHMHLRNNKAHPRQCNTLQHTATHCNTLQHTATAHTRIITCTCTITNDQVSAAIHTQTHTHTHAHAYTHTYTHTQHTW